MDSVSNKISLDIQKTGTQVFLSAIRGDTKRHIVISLVDGGVPYSVDGISEAIFTGVKADGNFLYNDCAIDRDSNTIVYKYTEQTTAASGVVNCQIKLIGEDGGIISTPTFGIIVADVLYSEQPIVESSMEFHALTAYVADLKRRLAGGEFKGDKGDKGDKGEKGDKGDKGDRGDAGADADASKLANAIIGNATGTSINVNDSVNVAPQGFSIYGKSTQNGTPTPAAPVPIESVGDDGDIVVSINEQTATAYTPNGLHGIPVTDPALATYTDENGQMWYADEIDLDRGVYVHRVGNSIGKTWLASNIDSGCIGERYYIPCEDRKAERYCNVLCTNYRQRNYATFSSNGDFIATDETNKINIRCTEKVFGGANAFNEWVSNIGMVVYYPLAAPIETPLSDEEIAKYNALKMNYPTTTITNDENAYMSVEYVVDTKSYIDAKFEQSSSSYISYIDLPSSKWQGKDNLYSQVVSIPDVTENSRVDINPSVEQLAIFYQKDITFVTENDDGVVTVYCIGQKPTNDYTMQVTITEVIANG